MEELTTLAMGKVKGKGAYPLPRHGVLLLSCMDQRLINELAAFMDKDNLTNRYDHLVFAGASLGVMQTQYHGWKTTFEEHLKIAVELHKPHDIYIVEHRNCGAYRKLGIGDWDDDHQDDEKKAHVEWAVKLREQLEIWWKAWKPEDDDGELIKLRVTGFLMDLRGDVELLDLSSPPSKPKKSAPPPKKRATKRV